MDSSSKENKMVKVIVAENKYDAKHMLGQFPTEADYDLLIEEDMDYIDEEFIVEMLNQYLLENDLPEEKTL